MMVIKDVVTILSFFVLNALKAVRPNIRASRTRRATQAFVSANKRFVRSVNCMDRVLLSHQLFCRVSFVNKWFSEFTSKEIHTEAG